MMLYLFGQISKLSTKYLTPYFFPNGGPTFGIAMDGEQTHGHTQDATLRVIDELQP